MNRGSARAIRHPVVIGLTLMFAIAFGPYMLLGQDTPVIVHDHLDAAFSWAVAVEAEGQILAPPDATVAPILGGVPRHAFPGWESLYLWIFAFFQPFAALLVNEALQRSVAFLGMYLFARDFLDLNSDRMRWVAAGGALCFALAPFWPPTGGSVAAIPLLFWAAFSIRAGTNRTGAALGSGFFVTYAAFVTSGVFALALLSCVIVVDGAYRRWVAAARLAAYNAAVTLAFIALQGRRLIFAANSSDPSSRSEVVVQGYGFDRALEVAWSTLLHGQYHANPATSEAMALVFGLGLCVLVGLLLRNILGGSALFLHDRLALGFFVALLAGVLCAVLYGFSSLELSLEAWNATGLPYFNFGRFHWMQPALYGIALTAAVGLVIRPNAKATTPAREAPNKGPRCLRHESQPAKSLPKIRQILRFAPTICGVVLLVLQVIAATDQLPAYGGQKRYSKPYVTVVAPEMFAEILQEIGPDSRFGLVGVHPAFAHIAGLSTVGGYVSIYPLTTKHAFREIIAMELEKSARLTSYFDNWGARAYLFSDDLSNCNAMCSVDVAPESISLDYDMAAFQRFGGTHLVSVSRIENADTLGLTEIGTFEGGGWQVTVYEAELEEIR